MASAMRSAPASAVMPRCGIMPATRTVVKSATPVSSVMMSAGTAPPAFSGSCHTLSFLSRWIPERHCDDFAWVAASAPMPARTIFPEHASRPLADSLPVFRGSFKATGLTPHMRAGLLMKRQARIPAASVFEGRFRRRALAGRAEMEPLFERHASGHRMSSSLSGGVLNDRLYLCYRHTFPLSCPRDGLYMNPPVGRRRQNR